MIPMGNWADRIDELESENFDLEKLVGLQEDEIGELLYQIDDLNDRLEKAETKNKYLDRDLRHKQQEYEALDQVFDELAKEKEQLELQRDDLRSELEYLQEFTENDSEDFYLIAGQLDTMTDSFLEEWVRANLTQARANSWFEIAKTMVRARDFWVDIADKYAEQLDAALNDYEELQTALRVLGGKKE